ncbi:MAG: hypothetical protein V2A64_04910 [Candidatus Omnitrophota bacterium]
MNKTRIQTVFFLALSLVVWNGLVLAQEEGSLPQEVNPPQEIFSLDNPVIVKGIVTENGQPLSDAKILLGPGTIVKTDTTGQFLADVAMPVFDVSVRTSAGEFVADQQVVIKKDQKEVILDFAFNPAKISGKISENGLALDKARVFAGKNSSLTTDSNGAYFTKVQEGQTRVFAITSAGEFIGEEIMQVSRDEDKVIDFDFKPAVIEVKVSSSGQPLEGVRVLIGRNAPIITDKSGSCKQRAVAGSVDVFARDSAGKIIAKKTVTVTPGQSLIVELFR